MGTVFQVPWTRIERWPAMDELHAQGFTVAALALSENSVALDEFAASPVCTDPGSRSPSSWERKAMGCPTWTIVAADEVDAHPHGRGSGLPQRGCCGGRGLLGAAADVTRL